MRTLSRVFALSIALALGFGTGFAQDGGDQTVDQKVQDIITRMDRGGLGTAFDRAVDLESLGPEVAPVLVKKLDGASGPVKLGIAKALLSMKVDDQRAAAISATKDVLKGDGSRDERVAAAELLALKGQRDEVKPLEKSLDAFSDPYVKLAVLKALKTRGRLLKAGDMMKELLKSDDFAVRAEAALRLGECDDFDSSKAILEELKTEPTERGRRAKALLESEQMARQIEKLGAVDDKDKLVKLRDKQIAELQDKIKQLEAADDTKPGDKGAALGPGTKVLKELEDKIGKYYVDEKKATLNALVDAAAKGMADSLDPFSQYMPPVDKEHFDQEMGQKYGGIGAVVQTNAKTGFLNIVRPIYGGPAYKAGIRTLDQIVEVEGKTTKGEKVNDLVLKLKGEIDTYVNIKVHRFMDGPDAEAVPMKIKRGTISLPSVRYDILPGKIGYLQLEQFGALASREIEFALNELEGKLGMRALILDLRGNPGGYLNQAVEICSKFLAKGKLVVYQQGREGTEFGKRRDFLVPTDDAHPDYPLYVLVDENSASASEIVSGCLQVHKRADLVGQQTFGKGSVQQIFPIEATGGKAAARITIAYYYLPDGRCIHRPRDPVRWRYQEMIRAEIERWKQEGTISDGQAKVLLEQYKQPPGGVQPDYLVKNEVLATEVLKKMALLLDSGKIEEYIQKHFTKDKKTLLDLVAWDGFDSSKYPDFDAFYTDSKTELSKDDVRKLLRAEVRRFAQDELAKVLPSDFQEDIQLEAAVYLAFQKLGDDITKFGQLDFIGKRFPKGVEKNPQPIVGKKGPPDSTDEDGEEQAPKDEKKEPKKDDKKPEKKEDF
ncbi:MAG TPA: S41 family peptidase [Planctomycetota bacterium]|nr:S41 family peptidase [Planctomycetota bacterium]